MGDYEGPARVLFCSLVCLGILVGAVGTIAILWVLS